MNYEVKDFNKEVIEDSKNIPVLVDFWAPWCGPCRSLSPTLEKLAEENKESWKLVTLNTDENQEVAVKYGIRGIPNVKLFINGEVVDEFTGALPEPMIREWLKKAIPGKYAGKIKEAENLIKNGETEKAKNLLQDVLNHEPDNSEAKILFAKLILFNDPVKAMQIVENANGTIQNFELAESIRTISSLIERKNNNDFPAGEVRDKYISAVNDLSINNFSGALEKFIDVIREDRNYDEDGARKACIAIFKFLGEDSEVTLTYRRDFGSALYV